MDALVLCQIAATWQQEVMSQYFRNEVFFLVISQSDVMKMFS